MVGILWFELGGEGQVEVIRWIKAKLENQGIAKAYLVDPYLGSNALQRVIARQGNENIALTIVGIPPAELIPDGCGRCRRRPAIIWTSLVATANEWSERLCGQISNLAHSARGEGANKRP